MKCIHCGTDTRGPVRTSNGGRCAGCSHRFAFEPLKDPVGVTDPQFHGALQRVSPDGNVAFTDRQLWYELNRKWMRPVFWSTPFSWLARLLRRAPKPAAPAARPPRIPFDRFRSEYLQVWQEVHGPVAGLVAPRESTRSLPAPAVAADVATFSFDRAVVTDHWETAAMLVANRFHFEHNCAVLSRDGYPEGIGDTVKEMLRRNPQLTVFALHDASPGGCLLPLTLRDPEWFPDPAVRVVDLGLRPGTAKRLGLPAVNKPVGGLPPRLAEVLPPEEVEWLLAGNSTELAALRPAQVLRAAYDGIRRVGHPGDPGSTSGSGTDSGTDVGPYYGPGGIIWVGDFHHHERRDTASVDGFG